MVSNCLLEYRLPFEQPLIVAGKRHSDATHHDICDPCFQRGHTVHRRKRRQSHNCLLQQTEHEIFVQSGAVWHNTQNSSCRPAGQKISHRYTIFTALVFNMQTTIRTLSSEAICPPPPLISRNLVSRPPKRLPSTLSRPPLCQKS